MDLPRRSVVLVTAVGLAQIKRVLPHRHPMLLLDRVLELVPGERVRATKAVTGDEPWYRNVPDDAPPAGYAYPSVLVIESWCQCGALLAAGERGADDVALFGGLSGASLDAEVYPGDVLEHRVRLVRRFPDTWVISGESVVGSATVLRVEQAMVALRPAGVLPVTRS